MTVPSHVTSQEIVQSLLHAIHDEDLQIACEAAQSLATLGDVSILPLLIHEREVLRTEFKAGDHLIDASEERREMALTMAIIALLPPGECEKLLDSGDEFERYVARRRRAGLTPEEFWGPIGS